MENIELCRENSESCNRSFLDYSNYSKYFYLFLSNITNMEGGDLWDLQNCRL